VPSSLLHFISLIISKARLSLSFPQADSSPYEMDPFLVLPDPAELGNMVGRHEDGD
jgi:hypothetical protein